MTASFLHPCFAPRIGVALLPVLLAAGCGAGSGADPARAEAPPLVSAVRARTMTLRPVLELLGSFVPRPESVARVSARVAGTVSAVAVIEGQAVGAGETLLELDATLLRAELARAEASVAEREAILERLAKGPRAQELDVAREELRRAEAVARSTSQALAALEKLAAHQELSPVRLEEARAARDAAAADVASARAALQLLEAGTRPERLREAEAALASARAEADAARARLDYSTVVAPLAGTVTRLEVRQGQGVSPGTPICEVADLATLLLRVRVPAAALPRLAREFPREVTAAALALELEGRLDRFGPLAEEASGGVWAYVAVANPGEIRPGMSGRAVLHLAPVEGCTAIPTTAVAERAGTPVVTRIADGLAHEVEVRTGVRAGGWVQILEGLSQGDRVATDGGYGLPDGQPVRVAGGDEEE